MEQAIDPNYDAFLLKAHLVQVIVGVGYWLYNYQELLAAEHSVVIAAIGLLCTGIAGILYIRMRSVVAYPCLAIFNAAQILWVFTGSSTYGFVFGLYLNVWFIYGSVQVAVNLVAAPLMLLSVIAWNDFVKQKAA